MTGCWDPSGRVLAAFILVVRKEQSSSENLVSYGHYYYTVLPEYQGKGIATEAAKALIDHLTSTTAATIVAYVVAENVPSVRATRRLGFVDAGPVQR